MASPPRAIILPASGDLMAATIEAIERDIAIHVADRPDAPLLDRFMAGYDRNFVLPDEREERDGFVACLALNNRAFDWLALPRRELVLVAEDADGRLLGGANFLATHIADRGAAPPIAIALNYLYVDGAARGKGLTRTLLEAVRERAATALGLLAGTDAAIFLEQNDPLRMTAEAYAADTRAAGIDQIDRLALWARLGARLVDIDYVQPALSPTQAADDGLAYSVIGAGAPALPAPYLAAHLTSFLGVSVLKGRDPRGDAVAGAMLAAIDERREVPLLTVERALARLRDEAGARTAPSLRALATALQ
ncbi:GNAT family N-acetyltransferase [Sphingomonas baiyangensis]|uniref:GNAT family N-acetyltransferase n=1 Tax=Sphingomonas baiyangensis TaxID=2572576 RepID=UPI00146AB653|nr:GNAT family N-acetyltransferase [Sphingomonas baiyangensis]